MKYGVSNVLNFLLYIVVLLQWTQKYKQPDLYLEKFIQRKSAGDHETHSEDFRFKHLK